MTEKSHLPHFLGLGTQKGGTTTLHQLLASHPQVFLPACKEVHYFDLNHKRPVEWYAHHFDKAGKDQHCGEITPFYLYHPEAPRRIKALLPNVKLIVLLRDPVERALSQVFHARKRGFERLEPADALKAECKRLATKDPYSLQKHSYLSRSLYLEQLDRYEALFPSEQLLVMKSETFFEDPSGSWDNLQSFLELQPQKYQTNMAKANAGEPEGKTIDQLLRDILRKKLLATAIGVQKRYGFGWDWANKLK
ncbi:sulfotransferase [Synechococcus sp. CC9616]|uniref:sulfotransferase family protein n=1 Tax=Synechococcus sp. CC9616 TaxID=110663 RepID=UPI000688BA9D|nr:sulfotransferase domain-containing protein [Synechococcus sp. CC9616]